MPMISSAKLSMFTPLDIPSKSLSLRVARRSAKPDSSMRASGEPPKGEISSSRLSSARNNGGKVSIQLPMLRKLSSLSTFSSTISAILLAT